MNHTNPSRKPTCRLSTPVRLGVAAVAACFLAVPALSNPVNPTVVNGTASFSQAGNVLTVTNSNGAIINWDKFSIAAGEKTHFAQASASSSVLNRVLNDPSAIYGTLSSNGRVWLINPAGIMVGAGGRVDTAAFVASTLNIRNEDFLAGRNLFINDGNAKDVINQGEIRTPAGGSVYLIGSNVKNESVAGELNSGIITTPGGETILAAGSTVSLIDSALPGVKVDITGAEGNATNLGTITAEAGRIGIAGVIVRNSGILNASSVVNDGGRIFLKASQDAYVDGNGRIVTTGSKGGQVEVLGNRVAVMDHAEIDASGTTGGGTIKVGGDYQGKNPEIQNANITYFGPDASLKADATEVGAGGTVIVWADDTTRAYGNISARGGASGGNGGFVETSGHKGLEVTGIRVSTQAPHGQTGTWLLDPGSITFIAGAGTDSGTTMYGANIATNLASTNVVVSTDSSGTGNITFTAGTYDFSPSNGATNSLSLLAYGGGSSTGDISLPAGTNVQMAYGGLTMVAGWDGASTSAPVTSAAYGGISVVGSSIMVNGNMSLLAGNSISLNSSMVATNGSMNVEAESLVINASSGAASLISQGNQTITLGTGEANGNLQLISANGEARLSTYGSQVITFEGSAANTLQLQGSNSNTTYGGNGARIEAGGSQSITKTSGSLAISLTAGTGTATYGGSSYNDYGGPNQTLICSTCATHNQAQIRSTGNQTISATQIDITGGGGGNGNWAGIESKVNSTVVLSGAVTIVGGSSGGAYFGPNAYVSNDAGIGADGNLSLTAGSISLSGGNASYGGAYIGGGNAVTVVATGAISLTGGTAAGASGSPSYGVPLPDNFIWFNPAIIGSDKGSLANLSVTAGTTLTLAGGPMGANGGSFAAIGGVRNTPVNMTINASSVSLTSSTALADRIGSSAGGTVTINSYGGLALGKGAVGTGRYNGGSLALNVTGPGTISQASTTEGQLTTDWLTATATGVGSINLVSFENRVGNVNATTANQTITFNAQSVGLGTINSGTGSSTISAYYDIHDNNGSSVTNITAGGVGLYSTYGSSPGYLAISADTATTGNISASVSASATNGGIYVRNLGGAPASIILNDSAATDTQALFYNSGSFSTAGSSFTAAYGGDISLVSGSDLTYNGGTFTTGGAGSIGLGASGTLAINSLLNGGANDLLLAGSTVNVAATVTTTADLLMAGGTINMGSAGGGFVTAQNVALAAGSLNIGYGTGGSGGITANNQLVAIVTGDVNIFGDSYGPSYIKTSAGDLEMLVGGNLNITGYGGSVGYIHAGYNKLSPYFPDASIAVGGDLKLNNGAYIAAANDVYLDLMGSASTLVLNDGTVGYAPSYILSDIGTGVVGTTHLAFLGRSAGGVIIDGDETTTTAVGGSGFFAVNTSTPATAGAGLQITYSAPNQDLCALSPDLCNPKPPTDNPIDEPPPTFEIVGPGGTQPGGTPGQTAGGTEGSFGGDENGDDKKKDDKEDKDKKSDNGKDGKKDDKPGQKKVAQCS